MRGDHKIHRSASEEADALLTQFESQPLGRLMAEARILRERGDGRMSYSRKVFIPLTRLCRDTGCRQRHSRKQCRRRSNPNASFGLIDRAACVKRFYKGSRWPTNYTRFA